MTEKAVRQLRTNFEKLGARLGENLAGQSYPSALLCIERVGKVSFSDPRWGRLGRRRPQPPYDRIVLTKVWIYRAFPRPWTRCESKRLRLYRSVGLES